MTDLEIVSRKDWGAQEPKKAYPLRSFTSGWFAHWMGNAYKADLADDAIMRRVQDYHQNNKGWYDFAYSFAIGRSSTAFEGRGWGIAGGHTEGHNPRSMAIAFLIGEGETATDEMFVTAARLLEEGRDRGYSDQLLRPHRAVGSTKCPGDQIAAWAIGYDPSTPAESVDLATPEDVAQVDADAEALRLYSPTRSLSDTMIEVYEIYRAYRDDVAKAQHEIGEWRLDLAHKIYELRVDPFETLEFINHALKEEAGL